MPKVSVVVPVYNVEKYLDRCVQSLLNQTLKDIEIILVDDGSPDRCPKLCDEYASLDNRIRVVHKQNGGLGMACNSGIEVATGEYIAFCDSDDWVDAEMYGDLYEMALTVDADAVYSGIRQVDETGKRFIMAEYDSFKQYNQRSEIESFALDMIASAPFIRQERSVPMSAKIAIYRRGLIHDFNIRFESERLLITEDLIFNLDFLSKASVIVKSPAIYYNYFVNCKSLSRTVRTDRFDKIMKVYHELAVRYNFNPHEFGLRLNRMLSGYTRVALCQICKSDKSIIDKYRLIHTICTNPVWKKFSKEYPVSQMPLTHRVFQHMINLTSPMGILILGSLKR